MTQEAYVVIGANFGDEGKGLTTDFLCSQLHSNTLNVLFNGGAQRGHTVVTPEGFRHVFHHFGSGTLAGAKTLLSRYFISNPMLFKKEWPLLENQNPQLFVDTRSPVTTPWDIMLNQIQEEMRGSARHGSCGVGINETVKRSSQPEFLLTVGDLIKEATAETILQNIWQSWVPKRLEPFSVRDLSSNWERLLTSPKVISNFMEDCRRFVQNSTQVWDTELLQQADHLVFEAGQGLLLDYQHVFYPYVTNSPTGLKNVISLAQESGLTLLKPYYCTRWYMTRHGAGPFETETGTEPPTIAVEDPTNVPHPFQGTLRYGLLDLNLLGKSIKQDLQNVTGSLQVQPKISLTCLDQIVPEVKVRTKQGEMTEQDLVKQLQAVTGVPVGLLSHGPTRRTVYSL